MDTNALFDVRGKTAFVTGASGGIGYMIADGLLSAGCRVFICSRKEKDIEAAAARLSHKGPITGFAADLGTAEGIAKAASLVSDAGALHILVNNAGATWGAPIDSFPRAGFEKVMNLNVVAPFELTKALLPALRKAATPDDPARVINIASVDGIRVPEWESYPYSASKAGIIHLGRHLAKFLGNEQISVNSIAPGFFPSKMTNSVVDLDDPAAMAAAATPLGGRVGTAEDIAGAVIFLSSRAGAWITGVTLPVAGGTGTAE
jgi:NAD(P)-dependent dehydrogenase (short-subunit alcohol dehydrogenase family)